MATPTKKKHFSAILNSKTSFSARKSLLENPTFILSTLQNDVHACFKEVIFSILPTKTKPKTAKTVLNGPASGASGDVIVYEKSFSSGCSDLMSTIIVCYNLVMKAVDANTSETMRATYKNGEPTANGLNVDSLKSIVAAGGRLSNQAVKNKIPGQQGQQRQPSQQSPGQTGGFGMAAFDVTATGQKSLLMANFAAHILNRNTTQPQESWSTESPLYAIRDAVQEKSAVLLELEAVFISLAFLSNLTDQIALTVAEMIQQETTPFTPATLEQYWSPKTFAADVRQYQTHLAKTKGSGDYKFEVVNPILRIFKRRNANLVEPFVRHVLDGNPLSEVYPLSEKKINGIGGKNPGAIAVSGCTTLWKWFAIEVCCLVAKSCGKSNGKVVVDSGRELKTMDDFLVWFMKKNGIKKEEPTGKKDDKKTTAGERTEDTGEDTDGPPKKKAKKNEPYVIPKIQNEAGDDITPCQEFVDFFSEKGRCNDYKLLAEKKATGKNGLFGREFSTGCSVLLPKRLNISHVSWDTAATKELSNENLFELLKEGRLDEIGVGNLSATMPFAMETEESRLKQEKPEAKKVDINLARQDPVKLGQALGWDYPPTRLRSKPRHKKQTKKGKEKESLTTVTPPGYRRVLKKGQIKIKKFRPISDRDDLCAVDFNNRRRASLRSNASAPSVSIIEETRASLMEMRKFFNAQNKETMTKAEQLIEGGDSVCWNSPDPKAPSLKDQFRSLIGVIKSMMNCLEERQNSTTGLTKRARELERYLNSKPLLFETTTVVYLFYRICKVLFKSSKFIQGILNSIGRTDASIPAAPEIIMVGENAINVRPILMSHVFLRYMPVFKKVLTKKVFRAKEPAAPAPTAPTSASSSTSPTAPTAPTSVSSSKAPTATTSVSSSTSPTAPTALSWLEKRKNISKLTAGHVAANKIRSALKTLGGNAANIEDVELATKSAFPELFFEVEQGVDVGARRVSLFVKPSRSNSDSEFPPEDINTEMIDSSEDENSGDGLGNGDVVDNDCAKTNADPIKIINKRKREEEVAFLETATSRKKTRVFWRPSHRTYLCAAIKKAEGELTIRL